MVFVYRDDREDTMLIRPTSPKRLVSGLAAFACCVALVPAASAAIPDSGGGSQPLASSSYAEHVYGVGATLADSLAAQGTGQAPAPVTDAYQQALADFRAVDGSVPVTVPVTDAYQQALADFRAVDGSLPVTGRVTDERHGALIRDNDAGTPVVPVAVVSTTSFDWSDAAVGIGIGLGAAALVVASAFGFTRRRTGSLQGA
jgi:hypothetical protein